MTFEEGLEWGKCHLVADEYIEDEILEGRLEPIYEPEEEFVKTRQFFALVDGEGNMFHVDSGMPYPLTAITLSIEDCED